MIVVGLVMSLLAVSFSAVASSSSVVNNKDFIVFSNEKSEFECLGRNSTWYMPNGNGHSSRYQIKRLDDRSILTIDNVNANDIGIYKCVDETKTETKFTLNVYYALDVTVSSSPQTVRENESISLKCKTNSVPRVKSVEWIFQDKVLDDGDDNVEIKNGGVDLMLKNMSLERAGVYSCIAIQEHKTLKNEIRKEIQVRVESNPRPVQSAVYQIKGSLGEKVEIPCKVESSLVVSFIWLKNHYVIHENISNFNDASILSMELKSEDDFGNYTCSAYNEIGELKQVYEVIKDEFPSLKTAAAASSGYFLRPSARIIMSIFIILYFWCGKFK